MCYESRSSGGFWLTLTKWTKFWRQETSLTLPVYSRDPRSAQTAIHHICISICIATSHTHASLNKLPSVWKHAPHCTHVHAPCTHMTTPSRCAYSLFFSGWSRSRLVGHSAPDPCTLFHCNVTGVPRSCFVFTKHLQAARPIPPFLS